MNRCITQIPLVASGEDLEEHKATKTWIRIGISLSQDEMISGLFFSKMSVTTMMSLTHLQDSSSLNILHSMTLDINLEGFDFFSGPEDFFNVLGVFLEHKLYQNRNLELWKFQSRKSSRHFNLGAIF